MIRKMLLSFSSFFFTSFLRFGFYFVSRKVILCSRYLLHFWTTLLTYYRLASLSNLNFIGQHDITSLSLKMIVSQYQKLSLISTKLFRLGYLTNYMSFNSKNLTGMFQKNLVVPLQNFRRNFGGFIFLSLDLRKKLIDPVCLFNKITPHVEYSIKLNMTSSNQFSFLMFLTFFLFNLSSRVHLQKFLTTGNYFRKY